MKPVAKNGKLYQMRLSDCTFCTVRQLSENDGASSSVFAISSDTPMALRSHIPRIGSRNFTANTAKITVGIMKTKNGVRQPK